LFNFKIPASGIDYQNIGLSPPSDKLAIKKRLSRRNTGHLATLCAYLMKENVFKRFHMLI